MKLTKIDKDIITNLNNEKIGLTERGMCALLNVEKKNRTTINKRLNKLYKNGVINRINAYPKIYYIDGITDIRKFNIIKIKCIKCGFIDIIKKGQDTKVCSNCNHRYWVTDKRKIHYYNDITV